MMRSVGPSVLRSAVRARPPTRRGLQTSSLLPRRVTVYEVGARDGLQNEPTVLSPAERATFVNLLSQTGAPYVEAASFVSPTLVPQMAGGDEVMAAIERRDGAVGFPVLVPNLRGFESAVASGARSVAVMTAASDTFSRNNVNSTIAQAKDRAAVIAAYRATSPLLSSFLDLTSDVPAEL